MTKQPYYPTTPDQLPTAVGFLVETIPQLRHDCAALAAALRQAQDEAAALRKALSVVVAKYDNQLSGCVPVQAGTRVVEAWIPVTPGELAVMRAAVLMGAR